VINPAEHFRRQFDGIAEQLPGAGLAWLQTSRREALERFVHKGYPSPRQEDWKYARLAPVTKLAFQAAKHGEPQVTAGIPDSARLAEAYQMVFLDGRYREDLSTLPPPRDGVRIHSLARALDEFPQHLKSLLDRVHNIDRHGFNALNSAFANDGVVIALDPEQALDRPLQLLFCAAATNAQQAPLMTHPRVLMSLAAHSRLRLIESHIGLGSGVYLNNCASFAVLETGARLDHYKLQHEAPEAFHISSLDVHQGPDSRFVSHSISLGAAISRNEIHIALDGPGADCLLNGLFMGKDRQYVDYHTRIDHYKSHCTSTENYKGVLGGNARGVFNGRVYVHPHAQKTDARQSNKNLLLSATAEVDTKPQLEIYADDVKCAHGATTGQLDETMVFYLRSRGLSDSAARALLTYGFARDIIDRIDVQALREAAAKALLDGMPDNEDLRSMIT